MKNLTLFVLLFFFSIGCSSNRLKEYDFRDRTVSIMAAIPPAPQVFTDRYYDYASSYSRPHPAVVVARVGTAIAKEIQAEKAEARLDSALQQLDVSERIAKRTLVNAAKHLGYRPVSGVSKSDYIMDLRVRRYGINASNWNGAASLLIQGSVRMIDPNTHRQIWKKEISFSERLTGRMLGFGGTAVGSIVTTRQLARLSVPELKNGFESLSDFAADRIAQELQDDYMRTRR